MTLFSARESNRRRPEDYIHNLLITIATIIFSQGITSTVNILIPSDSYTKVLIIWMLFLACLLTSAIVLYGIPKTRDLIVQLVRYVHRARPATGGENATATATAGYKRLPVTFGQFSMSDVVDISTDSGRSYRYHYHHHDDYSRSSNGANHDNGHDDHSNA
jgi:hypothetical protein